MAIFLYFLCKIVPLKHILTDPRNDYLDNEVPIYVLVVAPKFSFHGILHRNFRKMTM